MIIGYRQLKIFKVNIKRILKAKRHAEELLSLNNDISNVKHQMSSSQKKLKSLSAFHINLYKAINVNV